MDDYLWLVFATNRYIKVTGDYKILEEGICFVEGDSLHPGEDERGINYKYSDYTKPLIEHLKLSIDRVMKNIGSNGLPLMGGGDWNDGMNKVGINGKGTSVWLGFFAHLLINDFMNICDSYNIDIEKKSYSKFLRALEISLNNNAWDEDQYIRAFFDNGDKLGAKSCDECKIDLISQSFAILSNVIPFDRIGSVIKAVEDNLVDKNLKIIKLLDPPFKESTNIPGYIMDYPKGIRENGGQYTHSVAWYIMALIKVGYIDRAYQYYQMINPVNRAKDNDSAQKYCIEPYVIAADIYSNFRYPARGGWSWYTGSAGWFYNIGLTKILGFVKEDNYIRIEPNVISEWKNFELEYKYLDTLYKFKVNLNKDKNSIMVDGECINSNSIKLKNDKRIHAVIVNIKGGK
jgi:cellobiose phosphorylase